VKIGKRGREIVTESIKIRVSTKEELNKLKKDRETYDDVIRRLIEHYREEAG